MKIDYLNQQFSNHSFPPQQQEVEPTSEFYSNTFKLHAFAIVKILSEVFKNIRSISPMTFNENVHPIWCITP